jgi:hypothetical protein
MLPSTNRRSTLALRALRGAAPTPSPFDQARARWRAASARRRALLAQLDGCRAALDLALNPRGDKEAPASLVIAETVRRFLDGRTLSTRQLERELERLEDEVAAGAAEHHAEAEAWRGALSAEAARKVAELTPRHRAAVLKIAKAVEALSVAVEAERAVRRELAESELGAHASLPDGSHEFGSLHDYNSLLSAWSRRVRTLGLID